MSVSVNVNVGEHEAAGMNRAQGSGDGENDEVLRDMREGDTVAPATVPEVSVDSRAAVHSDAPGDKAPLPVRHPDEQRPNPGWSLSARIAAAAASDEVPTERREQPQQTEPQGQEQQGPGQQGPGQQQAGVAAAGPLTDFDPQPVSGYEVQASQAPPAPAPTPTPAPAPAPTPAPQPPPGAAQAAPPLPPAPPAAPAPAPRPRASAPALVQPTPESVPTLDPRLALALGKPAHGDSVTRRTAQSLRRLTSSAAQDVAEETRVGRELQQPVATGRVIAVTSIRGGVGKTTTAALLARAFNHYRHDPVLALEADAALGTLPVRLGAESVRWSVGDLAQILKPSMQLTDVIGYLVPVSGGGWLLPASQGRVGAPLDIRTYRKATLALRRYFGVTVVDCETLPGEVARTAMDTAHARVVVAPLTAEGVGGTRVVLDWLARLPHSALASTVVALISATPDPNLDLKTATAHLRETGVSVVHLPYDRHLAAGGPIRTELLGSATRHAATRLAAESLQRAVRAR
ncbi:nucleotide-binding protein [Streptomyces sp. NPDC001139]